MKSSVYILLLENGQYYIGSSTDVNTRFVQHKSGTTKSLKGKKPIEIVFTQEFDSISVARKVENKIKRYKSRKIIEKIIKDKVINNLGL